MIDAIISMIEAQGFHYEGFSGRVGEEVLTFKNDAGEVRTVRHGFTSVPSKPRNYKINFNKTINDKGTV